MGRNKRGRKETEERKKERNRLEKKRERKKKKKETMKERKIWSNVAKREQERGTWVTRTGTVWGGALGRLEAGLMVVGVA